MNGTRVARTVALIAALLLGTALTAATLLPTGIRGGLHDDSAPTVLSTSTSLVRTSRHGIPDVAPRTTPPPTLPAPAADRTPSPSAATTAGQP